jgi:hypothetical protein
MTLHEIHNSNHKSHMYTTTSEQSPKKLYQFNLERIFDVRSSGALRKIKEESIKFNYLYQMIRESQSYILTIILLKK